MSVSAVPALSVTHLTFVYKTEPVLLNLSCSIPQGTICAFVGPNGAGKTTLLKSILGLQKPLAGRIRILGKSYHEVADRIAYVPQRSQIDWDFPATVFDVVMMGRYRHIGWFWWPRSQDKDTVWKALAAVGMAEYAHTPIGQLSGGQQQRIFLARALVQEADIFFLDEPFVGIDKATEQAIIALLKIVRDKGKTVIVVHHDTHTLSSYFDWIVLINRSTIACGPVQSVLTPEILATTYGSGLSLNHVTHAKHDNAQHDSSA